MTRSHPQGRQQPSRGPGTRGDAQKTRAKQPLPPTGQKLESLASNAPSEQFYTDFRWAKCVGFLVIDSGIPRRRWLRVR